ncbi:copper resistance D family protein [Acidisoma sp. C75]
MPPFDLSDSGGIGLVLMRGISDGALALVFGTSMLRLAVLPRGLARMEPAAAEALALALLRLQRGFAAFAALWLALWLIFLGRDLASAHSLGETIAATGIMLGQTQFGHGVIAQLAALALVFAMSVFAMSLARRRALEGPILVASALALGLQTTHSHAFSMGTAGLIATNLIHILAAGAWLGSLPALYLAARRAPTPALAALCRAFSPLGQTAVLLLAITALVQGLALIGSWHSLFATAYGWVALFKMALFAALLLLAGRHRFRSAPALARAEAGTAARRSFLRSLGVEILLGGLVILAAGLLASLAPAMSM